MAAPYRKDFKQYMKSLKDKKDKEKRYGKMDPINEKKSARLFPTNLIAYSTENGYHQGDQQLRRNNPEEFNRNVNKMVIRNEFENFEKGIKSRDYSLERGIANTKKRQEEAKKKNFTTKEKVETNLVKNRMKNGKPFDDGTGLPYKQQVENSLKKMMKNKK